MAMPPSAFYKPMDLAGSTVLVTGATAGIGRAIAVRYAELGCKLALIGRRTDRLEALKKEIAEQFPKTPAPLLISFDLMEVGKIKTLPEQLAAGGMADLDILVNNAGMALGVNSADQNDLGDIQAMLSTNVTSLMELVSVFAPGMKSRGKGHIVNISSVAAHDYYQGGSVYCATKAAVNAFTIAARHDLAGTPLRVTAVSPGLCQTEFSVVRFGGDASKADKVYADILPLIPEDVADQVIYATTRPRNVQIADIISYCTNQGHAKYVVERLGEKMGAPEGARGGY